MQTQVFFQGQSQIQRFLFRGQSQIRRFFIPGAEPDSDDFIQMFLIPGAEPDSEVFIEKPKVFLFLSRTRTRGFLFHLQNEIQMFPIPGTEPHPAKVPLGNAF